MCNNGIALMEACIQTASPRLTFLIGSSLQFSLHIPVLPGASYPSMSDIVVESHGVAKLLSNVKSSKASGPDEIPCRVLKETAPVSYTHLTLPTIYSV